MINPSAGKKYYWIAANGGSCARLSFPLPITVGVKPTPEYMLGFPTSEEAIETQEFMLTAPIPEVRKRLEGFRERVLSGEIIYIRPANPQPPTQGPTMWCNDTGFLRDVEMT
jgi:hypothetical protein